MARIKLAPDDWSAFGPGSERFIPRTPPRNENQDVLSTIQAVRGAVQLADEGTQLIGKGLDWGTEVFAHPKTKEDIAKAAQEEEQKRLMEEAAAKRAEIVKQQEQERQRVQGLQQGPSLPQGPDFQKEIDAENAARNAEADKRQLAAQEAVAAASKKTSDEMLAKEAQEALTKEQEKLRDRIQLHKAEEEKQWEQLRPLDKASPEYATLANDLAKRQNERAAMEARLNTLTLDNVLDPNRIQAVRARDTAAAKQAGEAARGTVAPATFEQVLAKLPEQKVAEYFNRIAMRPETERTSQEKAFIQAAVSKYPQLRAQAQGMGAAPMEGGKAGGAFGVTDAVTEANNFAAALDKRKKEIAQNYQLSIEERKQQLANIEKAEEAAKAGKGEQTYAQTLLNRAANDSSIIMANGGKAPKTQQEFEQAKAKLQAEITSMVDPQAVQRVMDDEATRTQTVKDEAKALTAALVELQGLNDQRVKGGLSQDDAQRAVQLQNYIVEQRDKLKKFQNLDVANDPEYKKFVVEANQAVGANRVPPRETQDQREDRFKNALSMFDEQQKAIILEKAKAAGEEASKDLINADQLKLLAAVSALNSDERLASQILGKLMNGQVVGIKPNKFTDLFSGAHKDAYTNDIIKTLFLRTKGKSEEELAILAGRLGIAMGNFERLSDLAKSRLEKEAEDLAEKKKAAPAKQEKLEAEVKETKAKATSAEEKAAVDTAEGVREARVAEELAKSEKAVLEANNYQKKMDATINLLKRQADYFGGKNATTLQVARMGDAAAAILNTQKNFGESATAVGRFATNEAAARKSVEKYDQFYTQDANGNLVLDQTKWNDEFPSATLSNGKPNPKYAEVAAKYGRGDLGRTKLAEAVEAAQKWRQANEGNKGVNTATYKKQQMDYREIQTALQQLSSQAGTMSRTDKSNFEKLKKLTDKQQKILQLQSDVATSQNENYKDKQSIVKEKIQQILAE